MNFLISQGFLFVCSKEATWFLSAEFIFQKLISTSWLPEKWLLSQGSFLSLLHRGVVLEDKGPQLESWFFHLLIKGKPKHFPCFCLLPPDHPGVFPMWACVMGFLSLGSVSIMNFIFLSLHHLVAAPDWLSHKRIQSYCDLGFLMTSALVLPMSKLWLVCNAVASWILNPLCLSNGMDCSHLTF